MTRPATSPLLVLIAFAAPIGSPSTSRGAEGDADRIVVTETDDEIRVDTDALSASVRKRGYVSGVAAGSFVDEKTGAKDIGFGLHVMDFLMAPGWRDDGYERDPKLHGDLPKHYVEGPQICTRAKELPWEILRGDGFVALRASFTFREPGAGYRAGSTWEQTLLFRPGMRYMLSAERIRTVNDVDELFYRIDMPGHVRHGGEFGDTFERVYLSYRDEPIPAAEFLKDFGPDEKFLYVRRDAEVPERMIRAYQVKLGGRAGPWLAGMTLDPTAACEAWCHERGYVSFIQELHRRDVKAGESFGAAYVVGWFDDVAEMERTYDEYRGAAGIEIDGDRFRLVKAAAPEPEP